jgi:sugar phosphate isomerase/epimerase
LNSQEIFGGENMKMTRKDFIAAVAGTAASYMPSLPSATAAAKTTVKRGVSFYSYQEEYYSHAMTLEDCFAEMASMNAEGVEFIAEEMVPNYPNPPDAWVEQWKGLMEKYHTKPSCMDTFVDLTWGGHRQMTDQEAIDTLIAQFKLCNRMGYKTIRPTLGGGTQNPIELIKKVLPHAEKYDCRMAFEIHAVASLKSKTIEDQMELIAKTKTKHLGFTPDMGIFAKRIPRVLFARFIRLGAQEKLAKYIDSAYQNGVGPDQRREEATKMAVSDIDRELIGYSTGYGYIENDPKELLPLMPYVYNLHAKFYEMTENLEEYSIPYKDIVPVLVDGGYDGYMDSEFEGQRFTQDASETDSCEQIRRQQVMLRRLLKEIS